MTIVVQLVLLGLATGGLYVLLGLGIVLIYRGSGTVNFAQGAIAMAGTFAFWDLRQHGWPYAAAAAAGIAFSAVIGGLVHLLIMRPLRGASLWMRIVATLAVLTLLESIAAQVFGSDAISIPSELPTSTWTISGVTLGWNSTITLLLVIVLVGVLWLIYRYTRFGLATSAISENPRASAALGYSPDAIATANWAIGSALAAVAGILLAPVTGLTITGFTLLVIPALGAALVGNMASFPLTLLGGFAIGVIGSVMPRYVTGNGWPTATPFILILILLTVRGKFLAGKNEGSGRMPLLGTGRIRWVTVVPCFVVALLLVSFLSAQWADAFTTVFGTAIILLSVVVITGYTGQLSFVQLSLAGVGAIISGNLVAKAHFPFEVAILAAMVGILPIGLVVSFIGTRVRGINLAIATMSVAFILDNVVFNNLFLTGGWDGLTTKKEFFGINVDPIAHPSRYATLALVLFALAAVVIANLRRSQVGRRLIAVRANERAAESLGIDSRKMKMYAFMVGSSLAALGGTLLGFSSSTVQLGNFDTLGSINVVVLTVIGGAGWIAGAVIGGISQGGSLGAQLLNLLGTNWDGYIPIITGALLLFVVTTAPDGLAPFKYKVIQWIDVRRQKHVTAAAEIPEGAVLANVTRLHSPISLEARDLTVRFGGVTAASGVSLRVSPGELVGLIGPNGAGKSTVIDAITGFVRFDGTVLLNDEDVSNWPARRRAAAGLGRSFQSLELFEDVTVLENLKCASESGTKPGYLRSLVKPVVPPLTAGTIACIKEFQLEDYLGTLPTKLPYGKRRLVAIARAVAKQSGILLLDEPASGLDQQESDELGRLIRRLVMDWGVGVLMVEHNMDVVMSYCDRIYVLDHGRLIAEGTPDAIRHNEDVVDAYLGVAGASNGRGVAGAPQPAESRL